MTLFSCIAMSRGVFQSSYGRQCLARGFNFHFERFSTNLGNKKVSKLPLKYLAAGVPVTAIGAGYYYYKFKQNESTFSNEPEIFENLTKPYALLESKPDVPIARKFVGARNDFNLDLVLFQYPTCPFCCKVRAFLDYYGLPYEVVEVNPVLRQQTKWTTYRKVPIVLAKVDGGYQQLNDSTMIISALKTFLLKANQDLKKIVDYYPMVELRNEDGEVKDNILNKYNLMYEDPSILKSKSSEMIKEEKMWREWADKKLVHVLSPNVYRTFDESMQAFKWFSEVGEWDRLFPAWERGIIVYVGAMAMWVIGKRLKKRHNLTEDVRESLYHECRTWVKALSKKQTVFMGGNSPNLADLAVYGVLSSIEGCLAFNDLLENTKIGNWYYATKQAVSNHEGKTEILF